MSQPVELFELVLLLLAAAIILAVVANRLGLPPATAYLVGGTGLAFVPNLPKVELDPDLAMTLFVPPLLMASAYFTVWRDFKANIRPIALLAFGAVAFTTWIVGVAAHWVRPELSWAACFTLGAIVSPPDAIAAKAVLQRLPLPRRLLTILEGESLVNDMSGLVLFRFAAAAAMSGSFEPAKAGATFVWLAAGGIAIGLLAGWLVMAAVRVLVDRRLVVLVTFLAAWGSYIAGETAHASGVLSVVACGLVMGWRQHDDMGADSRTASQATWHTAEFCLEALVFVFIGLSVSAMLQRLGEGIGVGAVLPLALAVSAAVILARLAWVLPALLVPRRIWPWLSGESEAPPRGEVVVLAWAGMRGVISMAAALSLPSDFPARDEIVMAALGVIIVTLVLQGPTLGPLVRALGLKTGAGPAAGLDEMAARACVNEAALHFLEGGKAADSPDRRHDRLVAQFRERARVATRLRDEGDDELDEQHAHYGAWLGAVDAGRTQLLKLHRDGAIHDDVLHAIEAELDLEELRIDRLRAGTVTG